MAFTCRPRTLAGDMVLFGLGADVLETAKAVLHTATSALPYKAYSNARLTFEGAQILVVLSTHETYELAGTRAWVYFEMKSAAWRASSQRMRKTPSAMNQEQILQLRVEAREPLFLACLILRYRRIGQGAFSAASRVSPFSDLK